MGPILFNIYVTDLGNLQLNSNIFQYAEDTALILGTAEYERGCAHLQEDIHKIMEWFGKNCIFVNPHKTKFLCFRNPHKHVSLDRPLYLHKSTCATCECEPLQTDSVVKYLGLFLDEHLTWNNHVEHLRKRLRTMAALIYNLRGKCPLNLRITIYKALVESVLRYGITLYGTCSEHKRQTINKLIKRLSYGTVLHTASAKEKYSKLGILKVREMFRFSVVLRHYFASDFRVAAHKEVTLRKTERYVKPRVFTNYGKKTRKYYVPAVFNDLSDDICNIVKRRTLVIQIRKWCLETMQE